MPGDVAGGRLSARAAGCHEVFVDYGLTQDEAVEPDAIVKSLHAFFYILGRENR